MSDHEAPHDPADHLPDHLPDHLAEQVALPDQEQLFRAPARFGNISVETPPTRVASNQPSGSWAM